MNKTETLTNKEKERTIRLNEMVYESEENEKLFANLLNSNAELLKTKEKLNKANHLYAFISQVNQNIVRVKDEATLFENACKMAHDFGKFKMAWIGLFNADNRIELVGQFGVPEKELPVFVSAPYALDGPQDSVLKTGKHFICNNIDKDTKLKNWRHFAAKYGINSCLVLPIKRSNEVIGTFNLYATEFDYAEKEEAALLIEVTSDISFALDLFRREKKQKVTEEQIIKNEKRFRTLIEKSNDMITFTSLEGKMLYGSPSLSNFFGYTPTEITEALAFNFIHPDDISGYILKRKEILDSPGLSFYYQMLIRQKNGEWVWCECNITNMLDEPDIHAIVTNFHDISERRKAEQQIEFDQNNLNALINNTNDLMWSVDRSFNLITSNLKFGEIIKSNSGEIIVKGVNILSIGFSNTEVSRFKSFYERAFKGESFTEIEYNKEENEVWSEISFSPICKGDEVIGAACQSHDITESKIAELQMKKLLDVTNEQNTRLQNFAYIVSHNIRSHAANITGLVNVFWETRNEEQLSKFFNMLKKSTDKLGETIENLNEIITIQTDNTKKRREVNLSQEVNNTCHAISTLISQTNTEIINKVPKNIRISVVPSYLESILLNLITNGVKYRSPQRLPIITISAEETERYLILSISDNGIGIDLKKNGKKIFGMYKTFHNNADARGMGLFIAKNQIEVMNGKIQVESELGVGSVFKIYFSNGNRK